VVPLAVGPQPAGSVQDGDLLAEVLVRVGDVLAVLEVAVVGGGGVPGDLEPPVAVDIADLASVLPVADVVDPPPVGHQHGAVAARE
jgi:hypothetical protein